MATFFGVPADDFRVTSGKPKSLLSCVVNRWPKAWGGRASLVAHAVDRLKVIKAAGISTVADLTTYDVGRDISLRFRFPPRFGCWAAG